MTVKRSTVRSPPLRATAWIDGLRGLTGPYASSMHLLMAFVDVTSGAQGFLTMIFVLGGYVSSRKPIELMQKNDKAGRATLFQTLSTSAFRRGLRIYLPCFLIMLITTLLSYAGAFELVRPLTANDMKPFYFPGMAPPITIKRFSRLDQQLAFCFLDMFRMLDIWQSLPYHPRHNPYLWSICEEYKCSIYLYVALLACARLRPWIRLSTFLILSQFCMACNRWESMLYFLGAGIAQAEVIMQLSRIKQVGGPSEAPRTLITSGIPLIKATSELLIAFSWIALVYVCAVLACYPPAMQGLNQSGYTKRFYLIRVLDMIIPSYYPHKDKLYNGLSCIILSAVMLSTKPRSFSHRIFTSDLAQYLGRNFFGTVLVQHVVLQAGGFLIPHVVWAALDTLLETHDNVWIGEILSPERRTSIGLVVGVVVNVLVSFWLGALFTRTGLKYCTVAILMLEQFCCTPITNEEELAAKTEKIS